MYVVQGKDQRHPRKGDKINYCTTIAHRSQPSWMFQREADRFATMNSFHHVNGARPFYCTWLKHFWMAGMPSLVTYTLPSETLQTPTGDKIVESFCKEEKDVLKMSFSLKRTRRKGKSIEGEVFRAR